MSARAPWGVWTAAAALFSGLGCVTEERVKIGGETKVYRVDGDTGEKNPPEQLLIEATRARPESAKDWWRLGDFYEQRRRYLDALRAYEQMQTCIVADEKKHGRRYTSGLYVLGRVHARLRHWTEAVGYLEAVLALEPKDEREAILNKDFREAHYLLGAIYFEHRRWEEARAHLVAFKRLAGNTRADYLLIRIHDELGDGADFGYAPGDDDAPRDGQSAAPAHGGR